ncbi:hypothetical protein [Aquabacterium sp.]|uniref:hypothetical protein n=1 Tax=Aquabacterium sp. TaxID=1872578 RepID=UPI0035B0E7FC
MSQLEPRPVALAAPGIRAVTAHAGDLRSRMRQLMLRAQTPDSATAWARLAAHAGALEQSSYAAYLDERIAALLHATRVPSRHQLDGVRRVLEAVLDDVLHDPRRRGQAPADAATFNEWWDCVVGLIQLEGRREQVMHRGLREAGLDAGAELASWVQRLSGLGARPALRRAQLLAELLAANGVRVERPADEADLVACYQTALRRRGQQAREAAARAALSGLGVGDWLRLLAPQRCCALSKVSAAPRDGEVALADYAGCWAALGRISAGDLQLQGCRLRAVETPGGDNLLRVSFQANGVPFEFDYADEAGGFDAHFVEHLNRVAQAVRLPGSFLVDRVNSDTDVEVVYLPLQAAAALQLSGALGA